MVARAITKSGPLSGEGELSPNGGGHGPGQPEYLLRGSQPKHLGDDHLQLVTHRKLGWDAEVLGETAHNLPVSCRHTRTRGSTVAILHRKTKQLTSTDDIPWRRAGSVSRSS
jgi:hypothetical protein